MIVYYTIEMKSPSFKDMSGSNQSYEILIGAPESDKETRTYWGGKKALVNYGIYCEVLRCGGSSSTVGNQLDIYFIRVIYYLHIPL